jgi:hypothetical protein
MPSETKIYHIKDIIRHNESGNLDYDKSLAIINTIAGTAAYHQDHNILIDFRETTIEGQDWDSVLELSMHMARHKNIFNNKIANVVPEDEERLRVAKLFRACLDLHGFQYQIFTNFEEAVEWLSDAVTLNQSAE